MQAFAVAVRHLGVELASVARQAGTVNHQRSSGVRATALDNCDHGLLQRRGVASEGI
jgi:hypothetical protein